jgi:hypothetical protein
VIHRSLVVMLIVIVVAMSTMIRGLRVERWQGGMLITGYVATLPLLAG